MVTRMIFLRLSFLICYTMAVSRQQNILNSLMLDTAYDKRIPPGVDVGDLDQERPTNISVKLTISEIYDVNVNEMDFSTTCYLRQIWNDHRLKFNYTNITLQLDREEINKLWVPDTFFPESKFEQTNSVIPNTLLHIHHDGTVVYSLRFHVKFACSMDFHLYPLDVQSCVIHLESYGFTSDVIVYLWVKDKPVTIQNAILPLYNIENTPTTSVELCDVNSFPGENEFSCLQFTIIFQRAIGYYMLEIFVPDMLIVIMSWVSFWLHPLAVPGRISLGAITVLTMSSQGSTARLNAPQVSYPKAIDVWTLFQAMFVFAALIEFSIVNVLARRKVSEETAAEMAAKRKEIHVYDNVLASKQMSEEEADKIAKKKYRESQGNDMDPNFDDNRRPYLPLAKKIDIISRRAFPATYACCIFLFWVIVGNV
ncbi:glycine receptor subunit alpha-2-like isoform X2 [Mytilus galloprovincialis]|uniref:glycine receptor subunit alpha-2-like isoform X2 n=1 Tax=Mytilus galloprovincialis TaxID=29158 RepID=UPI003F7C3F30